MAKTAMIMNAILSPIRIWQKTVSEAFTDIIGSVTFILTAFSGISLLVSSIMIGILIMFLL